MSGDLAFFDLTGKGTADTIGIVLSADESSVTVILGDYQNAVSEESFSLDEVLGYGSVQNAYRVYTGEDLEDISEIALYSDPAAVAPDYIGSIDMANAWQIVAKEYTGNAKSAKIGDDVDNDGAAEVLVQKNVVPTANENEFLVYLSISKQMSWDTLLAQSTLGLTTQGKWKESDVGTVVNESNIGVNKTNYLLPGKGSNRNYSATITLTKNGQAVHTFTGWYNGTTPNASRCTGYILLNGLSSKAIIASVAVNLHNDGGGSGGTLEYTIDLDTMSSHNVSYAIDEILFDKVTDQLGAGIIYDGVTACDGTAVESEGTITWQITENENVEGVNYQNPTTGYVENVAQLVYRVRLDVTQEDFHSCADNMDSTTADPESYAVNQSAILNYEMGTQSYKQTFPVPYVRGLNYNIAFAKTDDDGNYLSGALFELYESDGETPVKRDGEIYTITTDASVPVNRFNDLPCGTYILRESRAAPGYSAPEQAEWEVTLNYTTNAAQLTKDADDATNMRYSGNDTGGVWTIINTKDPFSYEILLLKQNKAGEPLAGVSFTLTPDEEGNWQNCATDENGQYLFNGDFGLNVSYELTETAPIEGYYRLPESIKFKVQEDSSGGYVPVLENAEALDDLVSLKLTESDEAGKYVLEVTVINESGYILPETGGTGTLPFTIGGLAMIFSGVAIYFYRSKRRFEYSANSKIEVRYSATVLNSALLAGVGNKNAANFTYDTKTPGTTTPDPAPNPTYPDNTVKTTSTYVYALGIVKVDPQGNVLAGAEFSVKDANGDAVYATGDNGVYEYCDSSAEGAVKQFTTDNNGVLVIKGVAAGKYSLTEEVAPAGYNVLKDAKDIEAVLKASYSSTITTYIDADGNVTDTVTADTKTYDAGANVVGLVVVNQSGTELPSTGGIGTTIFYVLGGLLVAGAVILFVTKKRMSTNA